MPKTSTQIRDRIKSLKQQLAVAEQRERQERIARLLSVVDKSGLTDDQVIAVILEAGKRKEQSHAA